MSGDYNSDALEGFDEFFGNIIAGLSSAARRKASRKLGRALLKANMDRIRANKEPDGSPMEKRKSRLDRRGRVRKKKGKKRGKMFPSLRLQRKWKVNAQTDGVEITLAKGDLVARIHHDGERGFVGRDGSGKKVYTRFPTRRLLGFSKEDEQLAMDVAEELMGFSD